MIIQFLKNNHVIILSELSFTYRWVKYTIEKWFITNGWSIPRILWAISHPFFYPFICAYLIHDYMYSNKFKLEWLTRIECDEFFLYNLSLHNKLIWLLFYIWVRFWGKHNFKKDLPFNKKEIEQLYILTLN